MPEAAAQRRPSIRRIVVALLALLVLTYGGAVAWLVANETRIVFQSGRPLGTLRPAAPLEQVDLAHADGARSFGWVMRNGTATDSQSWVLYLHGNAANVSSRWNVSRCEHLRSLGLNGLAAEYRGYGGLDGVPSEDVVTADARAGYDYLRDTLHVDPQRIVLYGWSLGSAVAVNLAAQVPVAAVILEGAPASLVAIGQRQYPLFPIRLLMRNPFDSIRKIDRIHAPMLFLHSPEDEIIPISEARRLYDVVPGPKTFVEVRGGHIESAAVDTDKFFAAIKTFLSNARLVM